MTTAAIDPYRARTAPTRYFLHHLNPLALIAGVFPAMVALFFVRDLLTPLAFIALALLLLLSGARLRRRAILALVVGLPLGVLVIGLSFSLWVDPAQVAESPALVRIGDWVLRGGAVEVGFATSLRIAALVMLALVAGPTCTGPALTRSMVQYLRVPYRVGYTALAAYRFVPRFGYELSVIRAAHRVRGYHGGRGPAARIRRGMGYIVPLLAGAIRHAERVALSMDSRAFGAYPARTEREPVPFRRRDVVFIVSMLALSGVLFALLYPWQLP